MSQPNDAYKAIVLRGSLRVAYAESLRANGRSTFDLQSMIVESILQGMGDFIHQSTLKGYLMGLRDALDLQLEMGR